MQGNRIIWMAAGLAGFLALGLLLWALLPRPAGVPARRLLSAVNPTLNVRYRYDSQVFTPAAFDPLGEFALRLNGRAESTAGPRFAFYGKRIEGIGDLLGKEPAPILYDFVGSQYTAEFEESFGLRLLDEPQYEDFELHGALGLHQLLRYARESGQRWPAWFPGGLVEEQEATVEGWVFFHGSDLFYFYAVSAAPLNEAERAACLAVLQSMEFDHSGPAEQAASGGPADTAEGSGAENQPQIDPPDQGQGAGAPLKPPAKGLIQGQ